MTAILIGVGVIAVLGAAIALMSVLVWRDIEAAAKADQDEVDKWRDGR